jgi:formylglycine-generating enzyme required for sulfatase activity
MILTISGIPMVPIPHPKNYWMEGINPVTRKQWENSVTPLMAQGARFCLVEPTTDRGPLQTRQFNSREALVDVLGSKIPQHWGGNHTLEIKRGKIAVFPWLPKGSKEDLTHEDGQPVHVDWYMSKGWTLLQGGLFLLTDDQWQWSAQGGEKNLKYATATGELLGPDGEKLAHYGETSPIDVDDTRYQNGPFGLRHKTGMVREWTEKNSKENEEDRFGLRGGFYRDKGEALLVSNRNSASPTYASSGIGFRVGAPAQKSEANDNF